MFDPRSANSPIYRRLAACLALALLLLIIPAPANAKAQDRPDAGAVPSRRDTCQTAEVANRIDHTQTLTQFQALLESDALSHCKPSDLVLILARLSPNKLSTILFVMSRGRSFLQSTEELSDALASVSSPELRVQVLNILVSFIGNQSIRIHLDPFLRDRQSSEVRRLAAELASQLDSPSGSTVDLLLELATSDSSAAVRKEAARSLGRYNKSDSRIGAQIVNALKSETDPAAKAMLAAVAAQTVCDDIPRDAIAGALGHQSVVNLYSLVSCAAARKDIADSGAMATAIMLQFSGARSYYNSQSVANILVSWYANAPDAAVRVAQLIGSSNLDTARSAIVQRLLRYDAANGAFEAFLSGSPELFARVIREHLDDTRLLHDLLFRLSRDPQFPLSSSLKDVLADIVRTTPCETALSAARVLAVYGHRAEADGDHLLERCLPCPSGTTPSVAPDHYAILEYVRSALPLSPGTVSMLTGFLSSDACTKRVAALTLLASSHLSPAARDVAVATVTDDQSAWDLANVLTELSRDAAANPSDSARVEALAALVRQVQLSAERFEVSSGTVLALEDAKLRLEGARPSLLSRAFASVPGWGRVVVVWIVGWPLIWLGLTYVAPLFVLRVAERMDLELDVLKMFEISSLHLGTVVLITFVAYRRRCLDAWIDRHSVQAEHDLLSRRVVVERHSRVAAEVELEGGQRVEATPLRFREWLKAHRSLVVISGPGGAGKTTTACAAALWGLEGKILGWKMIPVVFEREPHGLATDTGGGAAARAGDSAGRSRRTFGRSGARGGETTGLSVLDGIRGKLQWIVKETDLPSERLVLSLLAQRRILVIIDGFSEWREVGRAWCDPEAPDFPAHAVIVTTRWSDDFADMAATRVSCPRLSHDRLASFVRSYVQLRGYEDRIGADALFILCAELTRSASDFVTTGKARLFVDEVLRRIDLGLGPALAETIPDLVGRYVGGLNGRIREGRRENHDVLSDARVCAYESCREALVPRAVERTVLAEMLGEDGTERIRYLVERLQLLEEVGGEGIWVAFLDDSVAEYLAARYIVSLIGSSRMEWKGLLEQVKGLDERGRMPEGLLVALRDTLRADSETFEVDPALLDEIERYCAIGAGGRS